MTMRNPADFPAEQEQRPIALSFREARCWLRFHKARALRAAIASLLDRLGDALVASANFLRR